MLECFVKLKLKTPPEVFSCEHCEIFKTSFFYRTPPRALLSVWWSNCLVLDICRPTLLNQKHNVGWFLLQRFIDLVRASSSHISRNHSNTFSSNKHAENKYWSKAKHCSKGYFFWYQGFDDLDLMSILIYVNKKVATFIKKSLGNSSSWRLVQKKNRQKMYFYSNR